jgi:anti-sigma B factor antagonist
MAELESVLPGELVIEMRADPAGAAIVVLIGELDISNTTRLRDAVASVAAEGTQELIFDLSQLRFMDSSGISVLLEATTKVAAVKIRDPSPIVRRVVETTGLTRVFGLDP